MDDLDRKLIELIQADGQASYGALGSQVGLSVSAVNERLKKLEGQGVIQGWRAQISPQAVGLSLLAFISVLLEKPHHEKRFRQAVLDFKSVEECHHVTGEWSYLLKVRARSIAELEHLISESIQNEEGVARTQTVIVLSSPKEWSPINVEE